MRKALNNLTALGLFLSFLSAAYAEQNSGNSLYQPCSVYGTDDRVEYYQADRVTKTLADSTAALFRSKDLSDDGAGSFQIRPVTVNDRYNLQTGENFADQPSVSFCSGALVGKDIVLTSAHCLAQIPCEKLRMVFDYSVKSAGAYPQAVSASNVYACISVIAQSYNPAGADYALIKLDREAKGRYPLAVNRKDDLKPGTKIFVIGYPSGMPVKIANNAKVRKTEKDFFITNLDTFRGNSGSPVFNESTMKIEGVLSRGGTDYVYSSGNSQTYDPGTPQLYAPGQTYKVGQDEGRGEDATKTSVFQNLLPVTEMERALDEGARQGMKPQRNSGGFSTQPAIYVPDEFGTPQVTPAVYYPPEPSAPEVIEI